MKRPLFLAAAFVLFNLVDLGGCSKGKNQGILPWVEMGKVLLWPLCELASRPIWALDLNWDPLCQRIKLDM